MRSPGMGAWLFCGGLAVAIAAYGCTSSSSSSSSGGGGSGDGGTGGSGATYACTVGPLCTQIVAPTSAMSGEQSGCAMQMGTFSTGACPTAGAFGCCNQGIEEQCAYSSFEASILQMTCTGSGTSWTGSDGGVGIDAGTSASAFIGAWARSGTQTVTCGTAAPTTSTLTGDLTITTGSNAASIVGTIPDGCVTTYTVAGMVATAAAGQMCNTTTEGGVAETTTVVTHTLTLSTDGMTITSVANSTVDKTATMTMCTSMSTGTFTKM